MTYEYNLLSYGRSVNNPDLLQKFNSLCAEGRELVAVFDVESKALGFFDNVSETAEIVAAFKRAKP